MEPREVKKDFPLFDARDELVYLDSAATSQTPIVVLESMEEYYRHFRASTHRGLYPEAVEATERFEEVRVKVAAFLNASSETEIIFTGSATQSANMLTYALEQTLDLSEGDEIVTTVMEHHSSLVPLQELARRKKLVLKLASMQDDFTLDTDEVKQLITERTKIVAVQLASNVTGTIHGVAAVSTIAHSVGATMVCDATAAVGHLSVDVRALGVDFLYFSAHKMCGPTGVGVLYGTWQQLERLHPGFFGGGMVDDVTEQRASWCAIPARFEAGTPNIAGVIGLGAAIDYLATHNLVSLHKYMRELTAYAQEQLDTLPQLRLFSAAPPQNVGIVSFDVDGIHPHDMAEIVGREQVAIRAGHHCALPLHRTLGIGASSRASLYLYNTKDDVLALTAAIAKTATVFS